ncbi:hypothetical protein TWF102_006496 [Orbilia oligospora]|uniref:Uncharacterized protein n=1 Tax=Orbilia oligospora TaxID=2813651 RepID=A0A7C8N4A0_ORBOL|nr:hypothetical protein TWF102_006496 [Orbilia oligospora]
MLSSKLILTAFLFSTASIAQLPSLKISNPKVATSPSSCTNKNAENATKLNLPPFIDVSNSEPNAASKPGSQPLSNQYGGGGARVSQDGTISSLVTKRALFHAVLDTQTKAIDIVHS